MSEVRPGKAGITRADIRRLIGPFYARIRADARLGPIFDARIGGGDGDWAPHLAKIEDFWANVMLHERAYRGNPMQVHMAMPEIRGADFEIWLGIFEETAHDVLPAPKAATFSMLARRIGASLRMGLEQARSDGPPRLTV
ncbi:MAG: group III truncated hemoglobin [Paracoccaceae bacterium]